MSTTLVSASAGVVAMISDVMTSTAACDSLAADWSTVVVLVSTATTQNYLPT